MRLWEDVAKTYSSSSFVFFETLFDFAYDKFSLEYEWSSFRLRKHHKICHSTGKLVDSQGGISIYIFFFYTISYISYYFRSYWSPLSCIFSLLNRIKLESYNKSHGMYISNCVYVYIEIPSLMKRALF